MSAYIPLCILLLLLNTDTQLPPIALPKCQTNRLDVLAHHGNHEVEETDSLDESETQNGVGEELATERWVAGNSLEESSENETDTDTSTTETDGGGTHTQVLGDLDEGVGHLRGVGTLGLGGDLGAGGVHEGGGALHGVEGRGLAGSGTGVGASEVLELSWLHHWASDLDGALCGDGGHLRGSHAKRRGHCDGFV